MAALYRQATTTQISPGSSRAHRSSSGWVVRPFRRVLMAWLVTTTFDGLPAMSTKRQVPPCGHCGRTLWDQQDRRVFRASVVLDHLDHLDQPGLTRPMTY